MSQNLFPPLAGSTDTELPAAVALADNLANPTTALVGACGLIWDGATWDRWTGAVTQSGTWTVQPGNTANTTPWLVSIHDGTTKATVRELGTNDALNIAICDGSGNQVTSFGGGTQYTEGDTDATVTGTALMWVDSGDNLIACGNTVGAELPVAVSSAIPLSDAMGNPTVQVVGSHCLVWNPGEAIWERWTGEISGTVAISGTVTVGTHAVTQSGTWTVTGAGGTFPVTDSGGSLTVDGTVAATQSGAWNIGTVSAVTSITNVVHVDDNGLSLTVDDGGTSITVDDGGSTVSVDDGGSSLTVDGTVAATQSGTWNVGTVTTVTAVTSVTNVVHVDDNGSSLSVDDGGTSLTIDGTVAATQSGAWSVSVTGTPTIDTELPAAVALSDTQTNPTTPIIGAALLQWNTGAWERKQGNREGTLLASAARTASTNSANIDNPNCTAIIVYLNITSAGTGNLHVRVYGVDPVSGNNYLLHAATTTTTVNGAYEFGRGATGAAGGNMIQRIEMNLPKTFFVQANKSDASSWTFSLGYSLVGG